MQSILAWINVDSTSDLIWLGLGLSAQLMFSMRFLVQWITSERHRQSVIPVAFWWLSICGGLLLFAYGVHRRDPVIMLGQSIGIVVYARNLWLIYFTSPK